ncbi:MAG: hypothetical protein F6J93_17530 [Oscillatoria sp. SIO1A7]|nr:hypothetical protein [Oscillatoria sp. SIO1A7]
MKRRKLIEYGLLGGTALAGQMVLSNLEAAKAVRLPARNQKRFDWIFVYWMPYDNNLSRYGNPILKMIEKGVKSENILVLVQADFSNTDKMSRWIFAKDRVSREEVNSANSAREEEFAEYLDWARSQFEAEKWAIAFLGHGGTLDRISPDDRPRGSLAVAAETQWMNIHKLSSIIESFNRQINNRVELFFFQNCNKGTIEEHYTLREAAKYTLSSQDTLGAPNYYYESLFQVLGSNPYLNGGELAEKIIEFDDLDMYWIYTVTENRYFADLPEKINPVIESILKANVEAIKLEALNPYSYSGDKYVDSVDFLQTLTEQSGADRQKCQEAIAFLTNRVLYRVKKDGKLFNIPYPNGQASGLGLFLPKSKKELEKYRYLPVFSDLYLPELFEVILGVLSS